MRLPIAATMGTLLCCHADSDSYRRIIETKYEAPLKRFEVIACSPATKVLWFDWEPKWWGSFNVIETKENGDPLYWYDIPQPPTAQSIETIRVVTLSEQKYLEVIDCTHMGNGMLYLYEVKPGMLFLHLKVRVIANLSVRFEPRVARIEYRDLDDDGDADIIVEAECIDQPQDGTDGNRVDKYHREFLFDRGDFREQRDRRMGREQLMN